MNTDLPIRKQNRLQNFDYSQNGAYFITICTKNRAKIFWKNTKNDGVSTIAADPTVGATCGRPLYYYKLSEYGLIVNSEINKIERIYNGIIKIDKYVVMPNHIHLIILIDGYGRPQVAPTISRVIQQFKGSISKRIGIPVWQRSFHDHIIRDEHDYLSIWQYIDTNPLTWENDCFYTQEESNNDTLL